MFLVGGFSGKEMDDLYFYDLDLEMWMQLDPGDRNLRLFHPSFTFSDKARSPPLEWSPSIELSRKGLPVTSSLGIWAHP